MCVVSRDSISGHRRNCCVIRERERRAAQMDHKLVAGGEERRGEHGRGIRGPGKSEVDGG